MNELRLKYPVRISASGYYARPLSKRAQEEVRLELEIMAAHQRNDRPMARNGYSAIWRSMAFGWVFAGSPAKARHTL